MKYRVGVKSNYYQTYEVEAKDEEEASENYLNGDMVYDKQDDAEVIDIEEA